MTTSGSYTLSNEALVDPCERPNVSTVPDRAARRNGKRKAEDETELCCEGGRNLESEARQAADENETSNKRPHRLCKDKEAPFDSAIVPSLIAKAQTWDGVQDPTGWLMSEKLDGMRALWDGQGELWSRTGHKIACPDWFKADLPRGMLLDGELFLGRGMFQDLMKVCRKHVPDHDAWRKLEFVVFDAPMVGGGLRARLQMAKERAFNNADALPYARLLPQTVCRGTEHVQKLLAEIESQGGEGLMLRKAAATHRGGRTSDLLKVKKQQDDEALVTGHQAGRGKHSGMLGALQVVSRSGHAFKIGTGFTDAQRRTPPPKGSVVSFKFMELTQAGIPRHPSFFRLRPDVSRSEFASR